MGFKEELLRITDDIAQLEINTILKSNMTGRKMPLPRHALIDIAQTYARKLRAVTTADVPETLSCNLATFDALRLAAVRALEVQKERFEAEPPADEDARRSAERERVLLWRIRRNCDQLKGMLRKVQKRDAADVDTAYTREELEEHDIADLPINMHERVSLRKIWDMGLEEVVVQTVVQIDGDVVTRVNPTYIGPEFKLLHDFHLEETRIALSMWKSMIEAVTTFVTSLLKGFGVGKK